MNVTRRGFFGLLASLPFVGRFVPSPLVIVRETVPLSEFRLAYEGKPIVADEYAPLNIHGLLEHADYAATHEYWGQPRKMTLPIQYGDIDLTK